MMPEPPALPRRSLPLGPALRRLLGLARPYRARLALALGLTLLGAVAWLAVPLGLRALINAVFEVGNRTLLDRLALGLLALFALQAALSFAGSYLLGWTGERVVADLRARLYAHLHRLDLRFFADGRTGEITSRLTNDVATVRTAVTDHLAQALTQGLTLAGSIALMLALNARLALVVFVGAPLAVLVARSAGQAVRRLARRIQDHLAQTTAIAEEALAGVRVVKAFAREPFEVARYMAAVERLFAEARRRVLLESALWSGVAALFLAGLVALFWFGGTEVLAGRLSAGDLVAFLFYALTIAQGVGALARLHTAFSSAAGASERLFELLDTPPRIESPSGARMLPALTGRVAFERVTFGYDPSRPVLHDVTLTVAPGETVALVGPSGAGKTTLLHLIPRFYDPDAGRVLVDEHDVRTVDLPSLRRQIALVAQDVQLFAASIADNIRYGRLKATDAEVRRAAEAANAAAFIEALPQGYATPVGERGVKLSGGQRQRIAIARALLADPRILLLDEATSALDAESEALVQEALARLLAGRTAIVVAHRLATVRHADRILVLDGGHLVEEGSHAALIARGGRYARLAALQFAEPAAA